MMVSAPELGRLAVRGIETCRATVNGRDLGNLPVPPLPVAPGNYRVQLKCPDVNKIAPIMVTVVSGQTPTIARVP
jgi:hypothetical protein